MIKIRDRVLHFTKGLIVGSLNNGQFSATKGVKANDLRSGSRYIRHLLLSWIFLSFNFQEAHSFHKVRCFLSYTLWVCYEKWRDSTKCASDTLFLVFLESQWGQSSQDSPGQLFEIRLWLYCSGVIWLAGFLNFLDEVFTWLSPVFSSPLG